MLQVTNAAKENLNGAIEKIRQGNTEDAVFRIVEDPSSKLTLTVDTPDPKDVTFEAEGRTILVVAEDVAERCEGRTLDDDGKGNLMLI
jgi:hypothetical protein